MKRFLFMMVEGGGNVPPQLGIAARLAARGHEVRVLGDRAIEADVKRAGAGFVGWPTAPHHHMRSRGEDLMRDWEPKSPLGKLKRVAETLMFGPAEKYARDTLAEIDRFRPDVLVVDCLLFGCAIAAEKSGLPSALLMHTVCQLPLEGLPPFGLGLSPGRSFLGRLRDRLLRAFTTRFFDKLGLPFLNPLRHGLGLPPLAHVTDQLVRTTRGLILTSPSFDFPAIGMPEHLRYVGAPIDDPSWATPWRSPFADDQHPLILVGLGSTFQNQAALTQRTIDALGQLPVRGLVTLGNVFEPSEFQAPPNVQVVASAPHGAILPQARVTVAHGGHGTVIKSLAAGVPVLCLPLGRDQMDNAARLSFVGAGLSLKPNASTAAICRTLRRLLDEPAYAEAARRLQAKLAVERESDLSVEELERLASAPARDRAAPAHSPGRAPLAPLESAH